MSSEVPSAFSLEAPWIISPEGGAWRPVAACARGRSCESPGLQISGPQAHQGAAAGSPPAADQAPSEGSPRRADGAPNSVAVLVEHDDADLAVGGEKQGEGERGQVPVMADDSAAVEVCRKMPAQPRDPGIRAELGRPHLRERSAAAGSVLCAQSARRSASA